jgi:N-acetylglucosaminyldiphosphoundecaprenol N-acetyl-beta-D-mannosaminyltransferase
VKSQRRDGSTDKISLKSGGLFDIPLFGSDKVRLLKVVEDRLSSNQIRFWIATVNPEFLMATLKDGEFLKILQERTSVNVVDGIGLAWARETRKSNAFKAGIEILQGKHRESLITGADLIDDFCAMAERLGKTVYFYGGWDDRAERTAKYFLKKYPKLKVAGYKAEDFDFKTKADFLFVCRAMKKQESWINEHLDKLNVGVVIGLGRTFDYYSGELPRAPMWMRRMGLEWLYSWIFDASRRKRKWELVRFMFMVLFGR